jgi:uncharacterized protein (DUF4415 family)
MKKSSTSKKSGTDFKRLDAMTDEDIDFSEIPEWTDEMFARAVLFPPLSVREPKEELTVRLDRDVAEWYRSLGDGYQVLINFALRANMQEQLRKKRRSQTRRAS